MCLATNQLNRPHPIIPMRTLLIAITLAAASSAMAVSPTANRVPDTGSASLMLVAAVSSLIVGRTFLRRR